MPNFARGAMVAASLGSVAMPVKGTQLIATQPNMTYPHNLRGATAIPETNVNPPALSTYRTNANTGNQQKHAESHHNEHPHEPHVPHSPHNHNHKQSPKRNGIQNRKVRNSSKRTAAINKSGMKYAKSQSARARGVSKKSRKRKRVENNNNKRPVKRRKTKRKKGSK